MGKTLLPVGSSGVLEIYHPSPDQSRLSKKPILGLNRQKKNKDHFTPILQHPSARIIYESKLVDKKKKAKTRLPEEKACNF